MLKTTKTDVMHLLLTSDSGIMAGQGDNKIWAVGKLSETVGPKMLNTPFLEILGTKI